MFLLTHAVLQAIKVFFIHFIHHSEVYIFSVNQKYKIIFNIVSYIETCKELLRDYTIILQLEYSQDGVCISYHCDSWCLQILHINDQCTIYIGRSKPLFVFCCQKSWPSTPSAKEPKLSPNTQAASKKSLTFFNKRPFSGPPIFFKKNLNCCCWSINIQLVPITFSFPPA